MAIILGKDVLIFRSDGETPAVAASKSCAISSKCDLIEKASATQPHAKEYEPGRTESEITLTHLVTDTAPFEGLLMVRGKYTLRITIGETVKSVEAICTQADIGAPVGNLATGTVRFKCSGQLA